MTEVCRWYTCTTGTVTGMTGDELRRVRRERLGMSQAVLADRLGTTVTTVARWERGERAISELVARFVQLLSQVEGKRPGRRRR